MFKKEGGEYRAKTHSPAVVPCDRAGRQVVAEVKSWSCFSQSHSIFVGCSKWGSREDITNSYYDSIQKQDDMRTYC